MTFLKRAMLSAAILLFFASWGTAHEWMAPKGEAQVKNPVEKSQESIRLGQSLYSDFCTGCHGADARGLDESVTGLSSRPPDLMKTIKTHPDGDLFWKIRTGRKEMPSFEADLKETEIWRILRYIRSLDEK